MNVINNESFDRRAHEPNRHTPEISLYTCQRKTCRIFSGAGPGFITANVDNDPGGILTYSQAGAQFGYALLWTLIPTTIALIVVQEMAARMGAVTGKGLSDLIREESACVQPFLRCWCWPGRLRQHRRRIRRHGVGNGHLRSEQIPGCAAWRRTGVVRGCARALQTGRADPNLASLIYFAYPVSAILASPNWDLALKQTLFPRSTATRLIWR